MPSTNSVGSVRLARYCGDHRARAKVWLQPRMPAHVDQARVITALREVGFGIREIAEVIAIKQDDDSPEERIDAGLGILARLTERLDEKQAGIDAARQLCHRWESELRTAREWLG